MSNEFGGPAIDISLRDYFDLLHRRRAVIIQSFLLILAVGFVLNLVSKPRYRSTTRILLEGKSNATATYDAGNPLSGLLLQDSGHDIVTQIGVIQGEQVTTDACLAADVKPAAVQTTVVPVTGTDLIDISVESESADSALRMAQILPVTYRQHVNKNYKSEIKAAHKLANTQLIDEQNKLTNLNERLASLREQSHQFSIADSQRSKSTEATDAEAALQEAEASVATAQAQLVTLNKQRSDMKPYVEKATETTNPEIAQIKTNIASLTTERAGLLVLFKHTSPKVEALDDQINDLAQRLRDAPANVVTITRTPNEDILTSDRKINETRVELSSSLASLEAAKSRAALTNHNLIQYGAAEQSQAQVEESVERSKAKVLLLTRTEEDLNLRDIAMHDPVTVVTPAKSAVKVSPRQAQNLLFASIVGLVLGVCFALLQEYLDDRINAPDHVKGLITAPALGFVPLVDQDKNLLVNQMSVGALMESYRVLRSNVGFATVDSPNNSILVTSTLPGEGKSTTSVNLAIAMALDGKKVILVDLDLRRPTVHQKFGMDHNSGVTNVLMGQTSLDKALQKTDFPGLEVLTSGPLPPNPAELMNSQAMRRLLAELKQSADVVILDSPPFLATADAQVLSALVDGVVFVVQFGAVRKPELRHAQSLLQQANGKLLGIVYNKIDVNANRDYSYGVYQHYSNYYSNPTATNGNDMQITNIAFREMIAQIERDKEAMDLPDVSKNAEGAVAAGEGEKRN
jgi:capsular exopolysaccharide synthesis family protein